MPRLRVLFADDQIPDEAIPDEDLTSTLTKEYPGAASEFIRDSCPCGKPSRHFAGDMM